jgi:small subunit ribosomal protein S20
LLIGRNARTIAPFFIIGLWDNFMANTASARKAARQSEKRRQHNASLRTELRSAIKRVRKAIDAGDKAAARGVLSASTKVLDSIADKKIIHKNKASRHKSRLSAAIKAMA